MSTKTKESLEDRKPGGNRYRISSACGFRLTAWQRLPDRDSFLSLYTRNGSKLLPRPISICEIDRENGRIRLVYRVTGKNTGTEAFSKTSSWESRLKHWDLSATDFRLKRPKARKSF